MKDEISAVQVTVQDLIVRAERDYGMVSEVASALRSANDNLVDASDALEALEEDENEEESTEE